MDRMEIRHSAILAWLLDPRETHGFSDKFLRAFLCEAIRGQSSAGSPTALEISQADLRDADVRREWNNIDILILVPRLKWAFIIENKFNSKQHKGQLEKYAKRVRSIFEPQEGALKVRGIFLTLYDEPPEDDSFSSVQYSAICEILPSLMETDAETIRQDVAIFVRHYLEIIREAAGMSEERKEMEALARQLYRSHKKVIEFIVKYGATTDFIIAVEAVFGAGLEHGDQFKIDGNEFIFNARNNYQFSFLPLGWVEALGRELTWDGCDNWWAGYPLICWLQIYDDVEGMSGRLRLFAEVGPLSDHHFRGSLITRVKEAAAERQSSKYVNFQRGATDVGKKYSKFLRESEVHISDTRNSEEIEKAILSLMRRFLPVFELVESILPEFSRYGRGK